MGLDANHAAVCAYLDLFPGVVTKRVAHITGHTRTAPGGLGDLHARYTTMPRGVWVHLEIKTPEKRGDLTPAERDAVFRGELVVVCSGPEAIAALDAFAMACGLRPKVYAGR